MQFIDILNFKKYFKKKGDNAMARVGHVNSLIPIVIEDNPIALGLVPAFIGQLAIEKSNNKVWIAYTATNWTQILLD